MPQQAETVKVPADEIPEGRDPYWWARNWEMIALMLRKLVAFQKGQSDG